MVDAGRPTTPRLLATGLINQDRLVCQCVGRLSRGMSSGDDPFSYHSPLVTAQISLIIIATASIHTLLRPLNQSTTITHIIAGILLGPCFLTKNAAFSEKYLHPGSLMILQTIGSFGYMIYSFMIGVQLDARLFKGLSRKASVVGLSGSYLPFLFGSLAFLLVNVHDATNTFKELYYGFHIMVTLNSVTYFIVTANLLTDLEILNSEIGHLATLASITSEATGWFGVNILPNIVTTIRASAVRPIFSLLITAGYYGAIMLVLRPLVLRMIKVTPEGKPMSTGHFFVILMMVMGAGYCGEYIGLHAAFGVFVFGFSLPSGPPLSSMLEQKLNTMVSGVLLPIFCSQCGQMVDITALTRPSWLYTAVVIASGYVGKFIGTIMSSLYYELPLEDAFSLALIMSCKGIVDVAVYSRLLDDRTINREMFTLLVLSMLIVTGICRPITGYLHRPSRRYAPQNRGIFVQYRQLMDLRLLVCVHSEANVPTFVNFLQSLNPTRAAKISTVVLQLVDLDGRATALLAPIQQQKQYKPGSKLNRHERIANAFSYFEESTHGCITVNHYLSVAPYASMHDDIFSLARDQHTSIIILPYHKHWGIDGTVENASSSIRAVNKNVISRASSSVGILVDRSLVGGNHPVMPGGLLSYNVAIIFLGGSDDIEALEYSRRMAGNPSVSLAVVWLRAAQEMSGQWEDSADVRLMQDLRTEVILERQQNVEFVEERVTDGVGTTRLIRKMEETVDLFIVGRRHDPMSPVLQGLTEWSECPELGSIGDMLTTSDFQFSVFIMQHGHWY